VGKTVLYAQLVPEAPGSQFYRDVSIQRLAEPTGPSAHQHRSAGHPAEKDDEHHDLRVRIVPNEEAEIPSPDRFVDEAGCPGHHEDQIEKGRHAPQFGKIHAMSGTCVKFVGVSAREGCYPHGRRPASLLRPPDCSLAKSA
jgi:hypothetical protein